MEKITIYTAKTCPYCEQVKNSLKESSIEFIEKDIVEAKEEWEDVKNLTNVPTTPTVVLKNEFLLPGRDFTDPQGLVNIILNFREPKYSENHRILELIKTLNYNTYTAFNRLSMLLQNIENKLNKKENGNKRNS